MSEATGPGEDHNTLVRSDIVCSNFIYEPGTSLARLSNDRECPFSIRLIHYTKTKSSGVISSLVVHWLQAKNIYDSSYSRMYVSGTCMGRKRRVWNHFYRPSLCCSPPLRYRTGYQHLYIKIYVYTSVVVCNKTVISNSSPRAASIIAYAFSKSLVLNIF